MASSIRNYVSEGTNISYEQIRQRFGDPEQIATVYVNEMETAELLQEFKMKRSMIGITLAVSALVATMWLGYLTICYFEVQDAAKGYAVVEIVEYERTENAEGEK